EFNNGSKKNNQTSLVKLTNLKGLVGDTEISGMFQIKNFDDPNLHIEYKGMIDLGLLKPLLVNETLTHISGKLKTDHLLLKTNWNRIALLQSPEDLVLHTNFSAENVQ